jgi:UDP-glucuronate decarboxylase
VSRVLVTGGAGFIGSHLCMRLLARGDEVICADNLLTGRLANLEHLVGARGFRFVHHDIIDPAEPAVFDVEQIYNLACPAAPRQYQRDPIRTIKTNTIGMLNVLDLARGNRARVVQASTSEVYGDPDVHPQREDYRGNVNSFGPRSCYDEGKRLAETLCYEYREQHGVSVRIARIFNTYGPRMAENDGRVVSGFIWQALRGQPLTVYGTGEQTRSFCYVDDLVEGLIRLMEVETPAGPINLGNPAEHTVMQLAEMILELTGVRARIVREPLPVDDPRRRRPDIALAERLLGWRPTTPPREGIGRTIAAFRAQMIREASAS